MTDKSLKVRLRDGTREIEIEGQRADVDDILTTWWAVASATGDVQEDAAADGSPRPQKRKGGRTRASVPAAGGVPESDIAFDANDVANRIKDDENFPLIQRKIIQTKGDNYHKVAFVLWFAKEALTSGQVHKILRALDVGVALSSISTVMKGNSFLTSAKRGLGVRNECRLTAPARGEFEKWLYADDK